MPDKPFTVAAYAAGASLAAITVFYVFGPTFFIDGENSYSTASRRKRGIIGLSNPANDCFINSVLQTLAGLGDLRLYLIRELHRRELDGPEPYGTVLDESGGKNVQPPDKIRELQQGLVTKSVKEMLDALNERPIYRKTISAQPFIEALERAFKSRISRNQQDAQEFLQVVAERLCDEHHAALKTRERLISSSFSNDKSEIATRDSNPADEQGVSHQDPPIAVLQDSTVIDRSEQPLPSSESGFPFEGKLESHIQCQHCRFRNKSSSSSFVTLTLNVPQKTATTLDRCFDLLLKTEDIDDFKCDRCRLEHALEAKVIDRAGRKPGENVVDVEKDIEKIQRAIREDPEQVPEGVELPPIEKAPKRRIKKYMRITSFPKLLAIHLSRSIFDPTSVSSKNAAKVSFPERLRLGGILDERWYKLLGIVCHKGSHNSGHYESFRRNYIYPPFATPDAFSAYSAQSKNNSNVTSPSPSPTTLASARPSDIEPRPPTASEKSPVGFTSTLSPASASSPLPSRPSSKQVGGPESHSIYEGTVSTDPSKLLSRHRSPKFEDSRPRSSYSNAKAEISEKAKLRGKRKSNDRWWRISDEKIKESKTSDVLSMQREVYLLFYEFERPGDNLV